MAVPNAAPCAVLTPAVPAFLPASAALVEYPAIDNLAKLAAAIRDHAYDPAANTITLAEGVGWPDLDSNVLYVRYFYQDLWEQVLKGGVAGVDDVDGEVVYGTPGGEYRRHPCVTHSHHRRSKGRRPL